MADDKKKDAAEGSAAKVKAAKKPAEKRFTVPVLVVAVVAACVVGLLVGRFVLGGVGGAVSGKTTLSEGELDSTVGTYVYNGQSHAITAREALEANTGVEAAKQDDGSYAMPSADNVLAYARNQVLASEVSAQGIEVTDDDMATYAKDTLGTDDYASLAETYGMSEDEVKNVVRQSAGVSKLYDKVTGTDAATAPEAPAEPAEGAEETPTADYGAYIVGLLGDEWDADKGTWAREDGPYYAALKDQTFSADSATYNQAMTAYYVAYQQYSQEASTASAAWTSYVNGLLANASISIGELVS